jgi:hypothetical protein
MGAVIAFGKRQGKGQPKRIEGQGRLAASGSSTQDAADMTSTSQIRLASAGDVSAILAIVGDLGEWFDADARERSIPIDLRTTRSS